MSTTPPDFESIKQTNVYGVEFWSGRELMPLLGYKRWDRFVEAIKKAMLMCSVTQHNISNHFIATYKVTPIGSQAQRKIIDYHLTAYALHLVLTHCDLKKPEIVHFLTYFTITSLEHHKNYPEVAQEFSISLPSEIFFTKESRTLSEIRRAFKHLTTIPQYGVSPYRIDLYFPDYKIAVECDEDGHRRYSSEEELKRQQRIESVLKCFFIRYNPDKRDFHISDVIHDIMVLIYEKRSRSSQKGVV